MILGTSNSIKINRHELGCHSSLILHPSRTDSLSTVSSFPWAFVLGAKIFGLSLGATCVLFVGLIVGYAGVKVDPE